LFERLEAHMNLPLSNAVNPALASALHSVSTPAPAQGGALSNALGSASHMRDDFAQHFARLARQNQPRGMAPEPAAQRQQLAAETPHRPDARFSASKTNASHADNDPDQHQPHLSGTDLKKPSSPVMDQPEQRPRVDADPTKTPLANKDAPASASDIRETEEANGDDPSDTLKASADPSNPPVSDNAWSAMVPQGLQTLQISERLQVITTAEPLPDPQSNAQFARSMGFDEQMIQRLFGTTTQPGLGQSEGPLGDLGPSAASTASTGAATATALMTGSSAVASASALAALVPSIVANANSPVDGSAKSKSVGDLLGLGAQQIQINDLDHSNAAVIAPINLQMPTVSTQNMLAMLSAFVPNAEIHRLGSDDNKHLDTIDLSGAVGDTHAAPFTPNNPMGLRNHAPSAASAPAASPASTDMAQAYQDLSDKLSTELAGRMHQQLNEGQWKMKFGLKPSHLGAVDVELEMRDGKLTALINTDNATTQQLLNQGSPRLREALNGLGWSQAAVNIGQGQSSSAQSGQGQGQNQGPSGQALNSGESASGVTVEDASPRTTQTSNALLDIYA
jgi:Flagellar hook-length control protein FliK